MILRLLLSSLLILLVDLYVFQAFRFAFRPYPEGVQRAISIVFWSLSAVCIGILLLNVFIEYRDWPKAFRVYSTAAVFVLLFSKLFVLLFLLTDDIFRGGRWLFVWVQGFFQTETSSSTTATQVISRSDFLIRSGLVLGSIPFMSLIYGMVRGAYDLRVKTIKLRTHRVPTAFHGFRIVQISDLHVGSFVSPEPIKRAVDRINALNADLILFTGDLVNNTSDELYPYQDILSGLKAKYGVYSTLGNHDYGDYVRWPDEAQKSENLQRLIGMQRSMGWDILLDEHRTIEKNGERISIIGVQNYSMHMRFPKYGNLTKATDNLRYSDFNILLSHDPSHWRGEVLQKFPHIHLTLSGHTHGFQFGVDIPGFRWSPVQYVYREWAGLYTEGHQHLYVNKGLGFLGYPGRVGMLPEISVFELERA
jgi:predicted MPP superfamily phosphohydrolase